MSAPVAGSSLQALLETLQDAAAPPGELTDAHLTLVNRLTGEAGKEFTADVRTHFPQLYKVFKTHISSQTPELTNAALQALGFCVFNSDIISELSVQEMQELLAALNSLALQSSDKNTRTRALWVISKQTFPPEVVAKEVSNIISTLETVLSKGEIQSTVVEYEALNVVIRLMEQTPTQMGEEAVRWAKLIIPLVVHTAHKVHLRGATALEMGMPLLLQKQQEVAAITEHLMTTKLISELQKLFSTKNETFVLKLWPLFVKLLGKALHRSGSFINSLLQLEELGFRSGSPVVKKIAFIAWKSLIDNFALNPVILCSAKRLKLLMQPLSSIHVRTESLALTKLEVWWYLLMRLGSHLPANFEQVCVPLIQSTLGVDSSAGTLQGTPSRGSANQNSVATPAQKSGSYPFMSPATPRMNLNSSTAGLVLLPSMQLLGIEMLLHFVMGPDVVDFAKQNKLVLSLEPLQSTLISSPSFFCKHASTLINAVQDGFIAIGKEVPDCMLNVIWKGINGYVKTAIESGNKKEKQGSEILTMLLQALKNIVKSNSLSVQKILSLIDTTVKELPPKVLGSPAYQIADMDLLNGTPALFLIQLPFHNNLLESCVAEERFFLILEALMGHVLSGPASPLAFSESVLSIIHESAKQVENKEHLWRMWSIFVNPLTEWINKTNEVNQGDALEHNFSAAYSALLLPVAHIFPAKEFPQPTMKSLLRTWSDLYRAFARCAALVATAEENLCCEELCAKILAGLEGETPVMFSVLDGLTHVLAVVTDCINFAPYGTKYQPKNRSPQTPSDWSKKKKEPLGKLASLLKLLVMVLNSFHALSSKESCSETLASVGASMITTLHNIISHVSLPSVIGSMLGIFAKPLAVFYEKTMLAEAPEVYSNLNNKLEKLLAEIILSLEAHCTGLYDQELLEQLCPLLCIMFQHKSKQTRNQCAHFWNATFAKTTALTYPEDLKSVLSQAKKKIPLLLPGFEGIEVSEDCSSPFSDMMENSQLDVKISGMVVKLAQKPDTVLAQKSELLNEVKDKPNNVQGPSAKMKLDFPTSKSRSEILLEEEKSVDFVFIPPETKARVLTEHQKEVLRSKRDDIPAMYNNLDASQDNTLFSQDTQSQEDSLDKSSLIEKANEDTQGKPQEENVENKGCTSKPDGTPEQCRSDPPDSTACQEESPTSRSQEDSKGGPAGPVLEEPPSGESLEESPVETAPREASGGNENTSNVSSSSSDIISGTPQPASRRQSFITLEKFESSENRPFSPSALNSLSDMSGSKQESRNACKAGGKLGSSGEENKPSKLESEQILTSIRRLTRRQSKLEHQGCKQLMSLRSEQESLASSSVESSPRLPSAVEEVEEILFTQSQALHSTDVDIKKAEDTIAEMERKLVDMDSKENTPPDTTVSSEQAVGDESQLPAGGAPQKAVRRSLRRRSEPAEGTAGSQELEDGHQKRDRLKEDEKPGQKKVQQSKDDAAQKQKGVSGRTMANSNKMESSLAERAAAEDSSCKESPASSARRTEDPLKAAGSEGQEWSSSAAGQKLERPRYHTRRSSQGLLSSIENSEADGSETKEEGPRRKRSAKVKNKTDSLEEKLKDLQPESCSREASSQGNEVKILVGANQGEQSCEVSRQAELTLVPFDLKSLRVPPAAGKAVGPASSQTSPGVSVEQMESGASAETFQPRVPEQGLNAAEAPEKQTHEDDCSAGQEGANASGGDEDPSECQHRRGKRLKRLNNCNCPLKKPKQEETLVISLQNDNVSEGKPITPVQLAVSTPSEAGNSHLEESLSMAPCAMSTPVHPLMGPSLGGEGSSGDALQGGNAAMGEALEIPGCVAGEFPDSTTEMGEAADQKPHPEQCLSESYSLEAGNSALAAENWHKELVIIKVEGGCETDQLQEIPKQQAAVKVEEDQMSEAEGGWDQDESSEWDTDILQSGRIKKVEKVETPAPENVALAKGAPSNPSVDSPERPAGASSGSGSPSGVQGRCVWSPSASPSTGILKRGAKRTPEDDSLSPGNKIRRVSFANPIYKEGLADDIDRRSPVIRSHSSPSSRSLRILSNTSSKHITTPTKSLLSPASYNCRLKSSKKCLITEMAKEVLPSPTGCVYPALAGCQTPIGVILPHITSNIHARGLGQLIRARNIKTVGDLSSLTVAEIKTLPILPPKVSNVKKALRGYHKQQVKSRGCEEITVLEDAEKAASNAKEKTLPVKEQSQGSEIITVLKEAAKPPKNVDKTPPMLVKSQEFAEVTMVLEEAEKLTNSEEEDRSADEEKLETDVVELVFVTTDNQPPPDLLSQINSLSSQLSSEDLHSYSGSQLLEMQEKLLSMANCLTRALQARWQSPPHQASE